MAENNDGKTQEKGKDPETSEGKKETETQENNKGNSDGGTDSADKNVSTPTSTPIIDAAKAENDRTEKINVEKKKLLDREEKMIADQHMGGRTMAGGSNKPKELTDTEYSEALERGEVNPLKEDGFIK